MKASNTREAWAIINEITATDYNHDSARSAAAGYPVYVCNDGGYICDLSARLEYTDANGKTVNVWIEEEAPASHTEATEATEAPAKTETTITLESIATHSAAGEEITTRREARLTLSADTTLKDIAAFEGDARRLIKAARAARNRGDVVTVMLCKGRYTFTACDDLKQVRFEMWEGFGDSITADGVHLTPSQKYNDDPAHDMWITGERGEILHEITA